MKKSEMVREAGEASEAHRKAERVCYCTPSRQMVMSVNKVCMNQNLPNPQEVADEMCERIAVQLRELTGRVGDNEPLRTFDTMDTSAAYSIWVEHSRGNDGSIVRQAFEQAAKTYEADEIAEWDAAKAAWEASLRPAAPKVRHKTSEALDPAQKRTKAKAQKTTVNLKTEA